MQYKPYYDLDIEWVFQIKNTIVFHLLWDCTFQVCPSKICLLSAVLGREKEEKREGTVWHWRRNWWLWSWKKGGGWTSSRSSCQSMQNSARWAVWKIKSFRFFLKAHRTKLLSKVPKCKILMKIYWTVGTLVFPTFRTFYYLKSQYSSWCFHVLIGLFSGDWCCQGHLSLASVPRQNKPHYKSIVACSAPLILSP